MLGWEFPPHISGGLGTACLGLTQGLAQQGVDVLFVVPRAFGDEDGRFARVLGANEVAMPRPVAAASHKGLGQRAVADGDAPALMEEDAWVALQMAAGLVPGGVAPDEALAAVARHLRVLVVRSPLVPYLTTAEYEARLQRLAQDPEPARPAIAARGAVETEGEGPDTSPWPIKGDVAPAERSEAAPAEWRDVVPAAATEAEFYPFSGEYGPDLMAEVARYALVVAEIARREPIDVVHAHDWMTFPAAMAAAQVSGCPLVVQVHASEYDRSGDNVNTAIRDIERAGLDAADRVIAVSHFLGSNLERRYDLAPEKLRVVHNAVTQQEQRASWLGEKTVRDPIVLYLGRVTYQKGPDYFIEAAARVVSIEPNVKFVISGSGDMLPQVIQRSAELGLARQVHFTGFLRGSDVERMYAMADIYVMPSVSEPFGISPLEAMAADVPVIVSRQSGVAEVVTNALKVDFWDVEDIANKILALLRYPALAQQLSDEARGEVRRLRWEQRGQRVRDIYREVVA
jgi:glycogen synthase